MCSLRHSSARGASLANHRVEDRSRRGLDLSEGRAQRVGRAVVEPDVVAGRDAGLDASRTADDVGDGLGFGFADGLAGGAVAASSMK